MVTRVSGSAGPASLPIRRSGPCAVSPAVGPSVQVRDHVRVRLTPNRSRGCYGPEAPALTDLAVSDQLWRHRSQGVQGASGACHQPRGVQLAQCGAISDGRAIWPIGEVRIRSRSGPTTPWSRLNSARCDPRAGRDLAETGALACQPQRPPLLRGLKQKGQVLAGRYASRTTANVRAADVDVRTSIGQATGRWRAPEGRSPRGAGSVDAAHPGRPRSGPARGRARTASAGHTSSRA